MEREVQPQKFGKFTLIEKIGSGGMAEVYKAVLETEIIDWTKVIALKKILPGYTKNLSFIEMFLNEAKISANLQHPNIIQIYEVGQIDGQYYISMEYVHGKDLLKLMARMNKLQKKISLGNCLFILREIAKALSFAHQAKDPYGKPLNIVHRDISPSNILISFEGNVKVMDFGIALAAGSGEKRKLGILRGKIGYMSPEQVLGKEVTYLSDIFSLGILFYELLTLKRLFLGHTDLETLINIREANIEKKLLLHPELDEEIKNILRKAVTKEQKQRFQSADEFIGAIENYLYTKSLRISEKELSSLMKEIFLKESEEELLPLSYESTTGRFAVDVVSKPKEPEERKKLEPAFEEEFLPTKIEGIRLQTASFKIKDSKGEIFGPVSFTNLLSLIKSHCITERYLCSIDEGEWIPIGEITSLVEYFPYYGKEEKRRLLIEGKVIKKLFLHDLYDIGIKKKLSGLLLLKYRDHQKEVYFRSGNPRYIYSTIKNELLGEFLIEKKKLTKEQLEKVLSVSKESKVKLGDALIKLKFLKPYELADLLLEQFKHRFFKIFAMEGSWYGFFENVKFPENVIPIEVELPLILLETVRKVYLLKELNSYFADHMTRIIEKIPNKNIDISAFKLSSKELRIYSLLDELHTINSIMKKIGRGEENDKLVLNILFLLFSTEFIRFRGESKFSLK